MFAANPFTFPTNKKRRVRRNASAVITVLRNCVVRQQRQKITSCQGKSLRRRGRSIASRRGSSKSYGYELEPRVYVPLAVRYRVIKTEKRVGFSGSFFHGSPSVDQLRECHREAIIRTGSISDCFLHTLRGRTRVKSVIPRVIARCAEL